jgi:tRNA-2-methylthio-N6-dimethylallyladenosine synthase
MPRPGDVVSVQITAAASFHLIADSLDDAPLAIRRTRAGDAWDRAEAASCAVPASSPPAEAGRVSLGLPAVRVATLPIYDVSDGLR